MARFVLWGTYCENAPEKRAPFRQEHLDRLDTFKKKGVLITLGPTTCNTHVFAIFEAESIDFVRRLIEEDVYWKEKIWTNFKVYPWTQAF